MQCKQPWFCSLALGQMLLFGASAYAQTSRACAGEGGIQVCRDAPPAIIQEKKVVVEKWPPGKLLFLLDIPSDIFQRLAQGPEQNRKYRPKRNWDYRPRPPAPPGSAEYNPLRANGPASWQYHPTASIAYHPTRDWSYDSDVFGRLWTSNIQHETRVVKVPTQTPGILLIPVQEVR